MTQVHMLHLKNFHEHEYKNMFISLHAIYPYDI
jgi:hypothetical protein